MFNCDFCDKAFKRKFNLARHLKTIHIVPSEVAKDINVNENDNCSIDNCSNDLRDSTNEKLIDNRFETESVFEEDKRNNDLLSSGNGKFAEEFSGKNDSIDQRILTAAEAIKSKFNVLRKSKDELQNFKNKSPIRKDQERTFVKIASENNCSTVLEIKLAELLQCVLDILMIKELQNIDITDQVGEENKDVKLKQPSNSVDEQINDEEIPFKRFKYDNLMECEHNDDDDDVDNDSNPNSKCFVRKYRQNLNTLVNDLRQLINTTKIGQKISSIMKKLNEIGNSLNFEHKQERDELMQHLNELKKTKIGQDIFCILRELEKAEIIAPVEYLTKEEDYNDRDVTI